MTLGVTGVVWLPRTATVNSGTLLSGAGPAPLVGAAGAWESVAAAYADTSTTIMRVMAVLAAGWEGDAANAAQARLGNFLAWTQETTTKAAEIGVRAGGQAAAYTTAAVTTPNPVEIATIAAAKAAAYTSGGALNGSAEVLEAADRALDIRAALVMESYEAATTPLAFPTSFDRPPEIVNDTGGSAESARTIDAGTPYEETGIFGFGVRTSPAQAAVAAVAAAVQNPAFVSAAGQLAGTAGSVAGSGVSTVASAATSIGSSAVSTLMNSSNMNSNTGAASSLANGGRADTTGSGPAATRAVSFGSLAFGSPVSPGASSFGSRGLGAGGLLGPAAGSGGLVPAAGGDRVLAGGGGSGPFGTGQSDPVAAARTAGGPGASAGARGEEDAEHRTPGYLEQFEHFEDGRTVVPSVIGADPAWTAR